MENYQSTVFIIDDNPGICESIRLLLESINLTTKTYLDPQDFLKEFSPEKRGCIISDIRMTGMGGLTLQNEIKKCGSSISLIFVSGHSDASVATEAMKAGAVDFLVKPINSQKLLDTVQRAISIDQKRFEEEARKRHLMTKVNVLTPREREIMHEVASGKLNKIIAADLNLSQKTVELHRSNLMKKLGMKSLADLVRLVDQLPKPVAQL